MYEHLIEFYNKKKHNIKRYHENSPEAIEIRQLTSFLDDSGLFSKIGYKQRIWHIVNDQLSLKTCVCCGNPVRWDDGNKRYSDTCSKECFLKYSKSDTIKNKIKQTNIQKYGAESYSQTEEGKLKQQQTCLEKYGVDNPAKADDYNEKSKKTCLRKYGIDNSARIANYKEKTQQTCLEKYGVKHYVQTEEYKEKSKKTCLKKYNVEHSSQSEIIKEKSRQTCLQKYGVDNPAKANDYKEKSQRTCLQKYGVENIDQLPEIKEKQKESYKKTCLERYGVISTLQLPEVKEKMRNTIKERFDVSNYSQTDEFKEIFKNKSTDYFKEKLKEDGYYDLGYRLISCKGNGNYEVYCPNCKQNFITNSSNLYYNRNLVHQEICANCNPLFKQYSCGEKEMVDYIKLIYNKEIIENDRSIIHPYELDVYLSDLHLAIEYNGDYWHANPKFYNANDIIARKTASQVWKKDKQKINRCIKAGIELLVIWEDDWTNRQDVVKQELLDIITELTEKRISC